MSTYETPKLPKFSLCPLSLTVTGTIPADYNGLLFPGGDEHALARAITRLATGEVEIPSAREIHERTTLRSYPGHVREFEGIYREVMGELPTHANLSVSVPGGAGRSARAVNAAPETP